MDLKSYLKQLSSEQREVFAKTVNSSVGHLQNVAYGYRTCAPELAVLIESNTGQAVTRKDLRPNDWQAIWPELAEAKTEQAQDSISDITEEAAALILHVAETAEAEIKRVAEQMLAKKAAAAEPWDGVTERRHRNAPIGNAGQGD